VFRNRGQQLRQACREQPQSIDKIRSLVKDCPEAVKVKDGGESLPLHYACRYGAPLEVIQYLVDQWPEALKIADEYGWLPLHVACAYKAPVAVIQFLVEQCPEALMTINQVGDLPLHLACRSEIRSKTSLDVVQYLAEQWPDAIRTADNKGRLPLHYMCANKTEAQLEVIRYLVEQWPEAVKATLVEGHLPLHLACDVNASLDVVQYLVEKWPESLKKADFDGKTPLDYAKKYAKTPASGPIPEAVAWLQDVAAGRITFAIPSEQHPASTPSMPEPGPNNTDGTTVELLQSIIGKKLRGACSDQPQSMDTIRSLVTACPDAIKSTTVKGWFPLHFACANAAPLQVVEYLVDNWPEAVKMTDSDGLLPLHVASANAAPLEVVLYLVGNWPEAVKAATVKGYLPLHAACFCEEASQDVIEFLVKQWPEAVEVTDGLRRTPLDYAKMSGEPIQEVIDWLRVVADSLINVSIPPKQLPASPTIKPEQGPKPSHSQSGISETKFKVEREEIQKVIDLKCDKPVAVTQEYVDEILTNVQLGQGFFGVVWKGVDTVLNTTFAVKAIHQELVQHGHTGDVQAARATFQRELDVSSATENRLLRINWNLSHPHRCLPPTTDSSEIQTPKHCILVRISLIPRASGSPVPHLRAG
jgi:ankyrin repeat protein